MYDFNQVKKKLTKDLRKEFHSNISMQLVLSKALTVRILGQSNVSCYYFSVNSGVSLYISENHGLFFSLFVV